MISVKNKFRENDLEIEFSGESIDDKSIDISVTNDVNFKPLVDYLIELIPKNEKLDSNFEDFSEEENLDKLNLIKETVEDIYIGNIISPLTMVRIRLYNPRIKWDVPRRGLPVSICQFP